MLKEQLLFDGKVDKVKTSIERLKTFEPKEGYYLAFSGGKDSIVIKQLADMSGVRYDAHYSVTTIDPPELVHYIQRQHKDVSFDLPRRPFLQEMVYRGFPQRQRRWCCEKYKERGGSGRLVVTGIRAAESPKRAKRKMVESCYKDTSKTYLNPIIDWSDSDVWEFIRQKKIPYCKLYDQGWKRIGCLFCPMNTARRKIEVKLYPKWEELFRKYFQILYDKKKSEGKTSINRWKNGSVMFDWWIDASREKYQADQLVLFE